MRGNLDLEFAKVEQEMKIANEINLHNGKDQNAVLNEDTCIKFVNEKIQLLELEATKNKEVIKFMLI